MNGFLYMSSQVILIRFILHHLICFQPYCQEFIQPEQAEQAPQWLSGQHSLNIRSNWDLFVSNLVMVMVHDGLVSRLFRNTPLVLTKMLASVPVC